jgi:hypothetical protein
MMIGKLLIYWVFWGFFGGLLVHLASLNFRDSMDYEQEKEFGYLPLSLKFMPMECKSQQL